MKQEKVFLLSSTASDAPDSAAEVRANMVPCSCVSTQQNPPHVGGGSLKSWVHEVQAGVTTETLSLGQDLLDKNVKC